MACVKGYKKTGIDPGWNNPEDHKPVHPLSRHSTDYYMSERTKKLPPIIWILLVYLDIPCHIDKLSRHQTNFFSFHLKALCHLGLVIIELMFPFLPTQ